MNKTERDEQKERISKFEKVSSDLALLKEFIMECNGQTCYIEIKPNYSNPIRIEELLLAAEISEALRPIISDIICRKESEREKI